MLPSRIPGAAAPRPLTTPSLKTKLRVGGNCVNWAHELYIVDFVTRRIRAPEPFGKNREQESGAESGAGGGAARGAAGRAGGGAYEAPHAHGGPTSLWPASRCPRGAEPPLPAPL